MTFPITRGLYNIYNNSSAAVPSSQATLNYVSEDGFLCKSSTATDIDPQTGVSYRTEIENAINANGFFPLDVSGTPFAEGAGILANPATVTDPVHHRRHDRQHGRYRQRLLPGHRRLSQRNTSNTSAAPQWC